MLIISLLMANQNMFSMNLLKLEGTVIPRSCLGLELSLCLGRAEFPRVAQMHSKDIRDLGTLTETLKRR